MPGRKAANTPHAIKEKSHQDSLSLSTLGVRGVHPSSQGHLLGGHPHIPALLGKGHSRHLKSHRPCPVRGHEEAVPLSPKEAGLLG